MQVKQKTQPYDTFDPVFDGSFEVPIDTEYNLPDYCPDIQKVLKCRVVPELSSYGVSEDTLRCEGVCDIRVLYLDAKGETLRCCDFTKEFSAAIKVKIRPGEGRGLGAGLGGAHHLPGCQRPPAGPPPGGQPQGPGGGPAAGAAHQRPGGGGHPGAGGEAVGFPGGKRPQPPVTLEDRFP